MPMFSIASPSFRTALAHSSLGLGDFCLSLGNLFFCPDSSDIYRSYQDWCSTILSLRPTTEAITCFLGLCFQCFRTRSKSLDQMSNIFAPTESYQNRIHGVNSLIL